MLDGLDLEPDTVLTFFGVFLGALSVLYFGWDAILDLTPLAKSFILVTASLVFLAGSRAVTDKLMVTAMYLFSAVSYLTFIVYYIVSMRPSSQVIFLLLGLSGAAFILIGRKIDDFNPGRERLKKGIVTLLLVVVAFTAVDLNAPGVEYQPDFRDEVEVNDTGTDIGTVTAVNSYFLPRRYSMDISECNPGEVRYRVSPVDHSRTTGTVQGLSSVTVDYEITRFVREANQTGPRTVEIQYVEECPGNPEEGVVHLTRNQYGNSYID